MSIINAIASPAARINVKGNAAQKLNKVDSLLEQFFMNLSKHNGDSIPQQKLENIMNVGFFLDVKLKPLAKDADYLGCLSRKYDSRGVCVGYEMELPFKQQAGQSVLPLNGNNIDTLMHETTHMLHYATDPSYIASDSVISKTTGKVLNKLGGFSPNKVEIIKKAITVKTHKLYDDKFYNCELRRPQLMNFDNKYNSGDSHLKSIVVDNRNKAIERHIDEFLYEIPDDEIKVATLKS